MWKRVTYVFRSYSIISSHYLGVPNHNRLSLLGSYNVQSEPNFLIVRVRYSKYHIIFYLTAERIVLAGLLSEAHTR